MVSLDPEGAELPSLGSAIDHAITGARSLICSDVTNGHMTGHYRWFCRLGVDGAVPDHSTLSKNRHGRFRDSDLLRELFEMTVSRWMAEGLVGRRTLPSMRA